MKNKLSKFYPVGYGYKLETLFIVLLFTFFLGYAFLEFFDTFATAYYWIFDDYGGTYVLKKGAMMPDFYIMVLDSFDMFSFAPLFSIVLAVKHYYYHYQGSKSIYLMKRLPDKAQLYKRCFAVPVAMCFIAGVLIAFSVTVFYIWYIKVLPEECVSEDQLLKLFENWRYWLNA